MSAHRLVLDGGNWSIECVDVEKCPGVYEECDCAQCAEGDCHCTAGEDGVRCLECTKTDEYDAEHDLCNSGEGSIPDLAPVCRCKRRPGECFVQHMFEAIGWEAFDGLDIPVDMRAWGAEEPIDIHPGTLTAADIARYRLGVVHADDCPEADKPLDEQNNLCNNDCIHNNLDTLLDELASFHGATS
jgi:hypothetical protein